MGPKRPAPAEQPPPAESSDEEETSSESGEEEEELSDPDEPKSTQQKAATPRVNNSKPQKSAPSSDSESESEPDEPKGKAPQASRPAAPAASKPQKSAPSDSEESESESDSDVTPVAAKPMEVQSTPQSKGLSLKRPAADDAANTPSKKSSNPASRGGTATGEESSRKLFQRVWNEEDEISILEGMIEFWDVRGIDPSTNISSFYEFIKERLRLDAVPGQLVNKIRNFKKKFRNYEAKGRPVTKPNEQRLLELCKRLWGSENGIIREAPSAKANGTTAKKKKKNAGNATVAVAVPLSPEIRVKEEDTWRSDATRVALYGGELSRFSTGHLDDGFYRRGLDLIDQSKKEELEQRWKKLQLAEMQLLAERSLLIHQQTKLIIEAYNRSE